MSIAFLEKWVWLCSFECGVGKCDTEKIIDSGYNFSSSSTNHLSANLGNAFGAASDVVPLQFVRACCFSYSMFSSSSKKLSLLRARLGSYKHRSKNFRKTFNISQESRNLKPLIVLDFSYSLLVIRKLFQE